MAKCRNKTCGKNICCRECESKSDCEYVCNVNSNWKCFTNWFLGLLGK